MYCRHIIKENVRQRFYNNKKKNNDLQYERHRPLLAF